MLVLVKLAPQYQSQLLDMMDEWTAADEEIIPAALRKADYRDFSVYQESLENKPGEVGTVPDSTYFCLDTEENRFVGAVNIRHILNERLLFASGSIGDGIRPSARGKGLGTQLVALALEKCRELGLHDVLMVCRKENLASARTIQKNGGVLANEVEKDGQIMQRYWIAL